MIWINRPPLIDSVVSTKPAVSLLFPTMSPKSQLNYILPQVVTPNETLGKNISYNPIHPQLCQYNQRYLSQITVSSKDQCLVLNKIQTKQVNPRHIVFPPECRQPISAYRLHTVKWNPVYPLTNLKAWNTPWMMCLGKFELMLPLRGKKTIGDKGSPCQRPLEHLKSLPT